jgi:hypothetical protein
MSKNAVKDAWFEVGDELESVALKLKLHLEQETSDSDDVDDVLERLAERIEDAIDAVGHAASDEAVRDDLRETGRRLVDALGKTFREATRAAHSMTTT